MAEKQEEGSRSSLRGKIWSYWRNYREGSLLKRIVKVGGVTETVESDKTGFIFIFKFEKNITIEDLLRRSIKKVDKGKFIERRRKKA